MSELQFTEYMDVVEIIVLQFCASSSVCFFFAGAFFYMVFEHILDLVAAGVVYVFKKIREREPKDDS